jgi:hypothetical protein
MARGPARRRAEQPRNRTPLVLLVVAVTAALVTVAALALWPTHPDGGTTPGAPASPSAVGSHAPVDLSGLPIGRTLSCDTLVDDALTTALAGEVTDLEGYTNGERAEIVPGVTDVAHEDSCTYANEDFRARVWVFAAPVRRDRADQLVDEARTEKDCGYPDRPTDFGTPELWSVCREPGAVTATLHGLFGRTWLSCEVAASAATEPQPDDVLARADRWCLHVAATPGAVP